MKPTRHCPHVRRKYARKRLIEEGANCVAILMIAAMLWWLCFLAIASFGLEKPNKPHSGANGPSGDSGHVEAP